MPPGRNEDGNAYVLAFLDEALFDLLRDRLGSYEEPGFKRGITPERLIDFSSQCARIERGRFAIPLGLDPQPPVLAAGRASIAPMLEA